MHMSDAVIMGHSLKRSDPNTFLYKDGGRFCGCALGGALLAVSDQATWVELTQPDLAFAVPFQAKFPWFDWTYEPDISEMYRHVAGGTVTIEQLADCIRQIEPACGECNQFECTCTCTSVTDEELLYPSTYGKERDQASCR